MKDKWLYDIILDGQFVGDQGDYEFDTKEDAINDANHFIENALAIEYERSADDFEIQCYQAIM